MSETNGWRVNETNGTVERAPDGHAQPDTGDEGAAGMTEHAESTAGGWESGAVPGEAQGSTDTAALGGTGMESGAAPGEANATENAAGNHLTSSALASDADSAPSDRPEGMDASADNRNASISDQAPECSLHPEESGKFGQERPEGSDDKPSQEAAEREPEEPVGQDGESAPEYDFGAAEERMLALQQMLREQKIPVVIVLEGWSAAGKGTMAGELLEGLDPRGYQVCVAERLENEKNQYPPMRRYWTRMPEAGNITVFIGSWYGGVCADMVKGKKGARAELEQAECMERMLVCDGVLVLKFFLDISKKEQKRRLEDLESKKRTCGLVSKDDWRQNEQYDQWKKAYAKARKNTDDERMEWHLLPGGSKRACKRAMYETILAAFERVLKERAENDRSWDVPALPRHELTKTAIFPHLELFETQQPMEEDYKTTLDAAQKKLIRLQYDLYRKGISTVIAFEGWDAAGKGGAIRRLTSALDARGFRVVPISAPTAEEKGHHHLWRFWTRLPEQGQIRIFDRTWYGRVMVERIEGFCTENQWKRAYEEMNLFEKDLTNAGTVLCKFWLQISNEEQLKRFQARQDTPDKQWKITDEDWRNREKWPQYAEAVDEMLQKTNTAYAPWTVVEADNKQFARLKVLHTVIGAMEKALEASR